MQHFRFYLVLTKVFLATFSITENINAQVAGMPASGHVNTQLRELFEDIDPPVPNTSLFYDLAAHFVDSSWYTNWHSDTINTVNWSTQYDEVWFSQYDTNLIPRVDTFLNRALRFGADTVVVGMLNHRFAKLLNGVFGDTTYFLIDTLDSNLMDNPNAPGQPYSINELFSIGAIPEVNESGDLIFRFDPQFLQIEPFILNKYVKGDLVLEVDFEDGNGWQFVNPTIVTNILVQYATGGKHVMKARVRNTVSNTTVAKAYARISAPRSDFINTLPIDNPNEIWTDIPGMNVEVYSGCLDTASNPYDQKFIIFAPGFDAVEGRKRAKRYKRYFKNTGIANLRNHGYTILIIDWHNSKAPTIENAKRIPNLISKLKCNYLDPNSDYHQPFVAMGTSSGALMMRYALAWMEQNPNFSSCFSNLHHNTRLFLSIDGEHQGAYIPLAFQEMYDLFIDVELPFMVPILSAMYNQHVDILNSPSATELMNVHYTTENNGQYGPHQNRINLLDSFANLNGNNGYPEKVKMVSIGNGLLTGEHQTGLMDECVMQPGDLYLGYTEETVMRVLGTPLVASDIGFNLRALEDGQDFIDLSGTISMWRLNLGFLWAQRCPPIGWPCIQIPFPVITWDEEEILNITRGQESNGVLEWDVIPGSRLSGDIVANSVPQFEFGILNTNFTGFNIQVGNFTNTVQTNGCPIETFADVSYDILPGGENAELTSQSLSFCFVPNFSAFDYNQPGVDQDHNIYSEPTAAKMASTPFDVIIGEVNGLQNYPNQNQQAAAFVPWSHPNKDLLYPLLNRGHVRIINHLMPDTFLQDDVNGTLMAHYLNREIGDEEMLLDNLDLDRNAKFQAQYRLTAGVEVNPLYEYPNINAQDTFVTYSATAFDPQPNPYMYSLNSNGIFSDDDPFRIEAGNTAMLVAQNSITDVGMDIQGWVWQNLQPQYVCTETYSDTAVYTKRGSNELPLELNQAKGIIYPNPILRGEILSLTGFEDAVYELELLDLNGRLLSHVEMTLAEDNQNNITRIPRSIDAGIYILRVSNNVNSFTYKISVQ